MTDRSICVGGSRSHEAQLLTAVSPQLLERFVQAASLLSIGGAWLVATLQLSKNEAEGYRWATRGYM